MGLKGPSKKLPTSKPRGSKNVIKKHQKIRTKLKVEQANKEVFLISELNKREDTKRQSSPLESLKPSRLVKDIKKDQNAQKQLESQRKATDENVLRQLELISGFSL